MPKKIGKEISWTDDEAELLLNVTIDYKTKKAAECVDWEPLKNRYTGKFSCTLCRHGKDSFTDFPHTCNNEQITK